MSICLREFWEITPKTSCLPGKYLIESLLDDHQKVKEEQWEHSTQSEGFSSTVIIPPDTYVTASVLLTIWMTVNIDVRCLT